MHEPYMQVRTYDVVPISPSLGMVAFVPGTKPLKALLTDPALVSPEAVAAADNRYSTFILTKGGNLERAGQILLHTHFTHSALSCVQQRSHVPFCSPAAARLPGVFQELSASCAPECCYASAVGASATKQRGRSCKSAKTCFSEYA